MNAIYDRLGRELGFDKERRPTPEQMAAGVRILLAERERALTTAQDFSRRRREVKARGRRQVSRAEAEAFDESLARLRLAWRSKVGRDVD